MLNSKAPLAPVAHVACKANAVTYALLLLAVLAFPPIASAHGLRLHGPVAVAGDKLPHAQANSGYGCTGRNQSPALRWFRVPEGTRSLAVTVIDVDAPGGSGWWHWVVHDIPANAKGVRAGAGVEDSTSLPRGTRQARNDFGQRAYGGACPPRGDRPHRYVFTVHALDAASLDVPDDASPTEISDLIRRHSIAQSSTTATYGR